MTIELTLSQQALLPFYIEKWDKIQNSTELIDRKRATTAVHAFYRVQGFELPQEIVFVETIKEVQVALFAYIMNDDHPDLKISDCWRVAEEAYSGIVPENASSELLTALIEATQKYDECLHGSVMCLTECAEYDFMKEIIGVDDLSLAEAWLAVGRECGIVLFFDKICIVSERKVRKELLNI